MNYKEFKQYVDKTNKSIADKLKDNEEELAFYINLVKRFNDICDKKEELKKQQQKFINYLEDEIHSCEAVSDLLFNSNKEMKVYKEILQKYREIIGGKKE